MNSGEEISCQLVVASGDPPEVLGAAEAALDDVSPLVGSFVEAMEGDAVGLVGNNGLRTTIDDLRAQRVAVIPFVGDERAHGRRECQNIGRGRDVGILTGGQMKDNWPAERIAQRMDFGRAPAARSADRLIVLPPFPPEAHR